MAARPASDCRRELVGGSPDPSIVVTMTEPRECRTETDSRRCDSHDRDAGHCQLTGRHPGLHTARTMQAVLRWEETEIQRWPLSLDLAPWLNYLPWAAPNIEAGETAGRSLLLSAG